MPTLPHSRPDPGDSITLPTMDDLLPGSRRLGGCSISKDAGEAIRRLCDEMGIHPPENMEALPVLVDRLRPKTQDPSR